MLKRIGRLERFLIYKHLSDDFIIGGGFCSIVFSLSFSFDGHCKKWKLKQARFESCLHLLPFVFV